MAATPRRGRPLNPKQARFVAEYLVDQNATQAAIRAGYSKKTAASQAHDLLKHPEILRMIAEKAKTAIQRAAQALKDVELSAARVLTEYGRVAFSDVGALFDDQGHLKHIHDIPLLARAAIAGVKVRRVRRDVTADGRVTEEDIIEIKLAPKVPALEGLARHFRLFEPDAPPPDKPREPIVIVVQAPPPGQEHRALPIGSSGHGAVASPGIPDFSRVRGTEGYAK